MFCAVFSVLTESVITNFCTAIGLFSSRFFILFQFLNMYFSSRKSSFYLFLSRAPVSAINLFSDSLIPDNCSNYLTLIPTK